MTVIGITGGVGCGKSAVLQFLKEEYKAVIVETDKLAHELEQKGNLCYNEIVSYFGREILDKDGIIDRKKLGTIVFNDSHKLEVLNSIVHPAVVDAIRQIIVDNKDKPGYLFVESALLFESHIDRLCDKTWYVYTTETVRRQRLKERRGYSDEKISDMMKSQCREDEFKNLCDCIIDNNDDLCKTYAQIREELA